MTFLVSGVLGTLYFCLDNDNLLFWSREKGGSSEPNELPLDPPLIYNVPIRRMKDRNPNFLLVKHVSASVPTDVPLIKYAC